MYYALYICLGSASEFSGLGGNYFLCAIYHISTCVSSNWALLILDKSSVALFGTNSIMFLWLRYSLKKEMSTM